MEGGTSGGIAAYYDNLSRFLDLARRLGRGGGAPQEATHRFLAAAPGDADGDADSGVAGPERLDHLALDAALASGLPPQPRVLDAGCGLGGTAFRWQARIGGVYDGLTLSPQQQRRAAAAAVRRGVAGSCRFHLHSYHAPPEGPFDAAIAIESLAHSPDPAAAVAALAAVLAPGGLLLIVDDMPEGTAAAGLLAAFKAGWRCPVLADAAGFRAAFAAAGLDLLREADLTDRLRPRPLAWLKVLIAAFGLARRLAPARGARDVLDALRGGFLLEALYRVGAMRYRLLVAGKPGAAAGDARVG